MTRHQTRPRLGRTLGWIAFATLMLTSLTACGAQPTDGPAPDLSPGTTHGGGVEDVGAKPTGEEPGDPDPVATVVDPPPADEDCVSYNPAILTIVASGDAWLMKDGSHALKLFDTKADAEDGRRVARNWTHMCFIGRDNTNPDRYRYLVSYWRTASGLPLGLAPTLDCLTYDPTKLGIYGGAAHPANPDQSDWALHSGATPLLYLASQPDALRAKLVASEHTRLCFIGRGNTRPDPSRYVMQWWQR